MRSRSAASPRCSARTPIPAWRSRSRCASTTCRTSSRSARWRRRRRCPTRCGEDDLAGPRRPAATLALVTIDGETARDFDDAVYCEARRRQGLAPAGRDRRRQPLRAPRRRARPRGARARHLGLLPAARDPDAAGEAVERPVLAQPEVDRLAHGVRHGDRRRRARSARYQFYPAVIRSHARLTYTEVGGDPGRSAGEAAPAQRLVPHLRSARGCSRCCSRRAAKRGAIDFETIETQMIFDANGKIETHRAEPRNDAHRLIEECMLAANVCAGRLPRRAQASGALPRARGPDAGEGRRRCASSSPSSACTLARRRRSRGRRTTRSCSSSIQGPPGARCCRRCCCARCKQAVYSPEQRRPFRPRLRGLHALHLADPALSGPARAPRDQGGACEQDATMPGSTGRRSGTHCSETERRADEATRDVESWLKCYYMRDHVGEKFDGTITGVTPSACSSRSTTSSSTAWCTSPSSAAITSSSTPRATCCSASAPASASGSPTA